MGISKEQSDSISIWQLTDEQRQQIYEQEKERIEKTSPMLSKRTKILIAIYFLGCLLIYFGVMRSLLDFWNTRQWAYQPESDIFLSLLNAIIELVRPFLAVWLIAIIVALPAGIVSVFWSCGANFIKRLGKN